MGIDSAATTRRAAAQPTGRMRRLSQRKFEAMLDAEATEEHMRTVYGNKVRLKNPPLPYRAHKTSHQSVDKARSELEVVATLVSDEAASLEPPQQEPATGSDSAVLVGLASDVFASDKHEDGAVAFGTWSDEEDQWLLNAMQDVANADGVAEGRVGWSRVATKVPTRSGKQCRERWHNHLNPDVNKAAWTDEEEQIIVEHYCALGPRWARIAEVLNTNRTDNQVKNHFNGSLMKRGMELLRSEVQKRASANPSPCTTVVAKPARPSKKARVAEGDALEEAGKVTMADVEQYVAAMDPLDSLLADEPPLEPEAPDTEPRRRPAPEPPAPKKKSKKKANASPCKDWSAMLDAEETLDPHAGRIHTYSSSAYRRSGWYHFRITQAHTYTSDDVGHPFDPINTRMAKHADARTCAYDGLPHMFA